MGILCVGVLLGLLVAGFVVAQPRAAESTVPAFVQVGVCFKADGAVGTIAEPTTGLITTVTAIDGTWVRVRLTSPFETWLNLAQLKTVQIMPASVCQPGKK
jgi:hypothetical protein